MKLTARFVCLTPACSESGTVDFVEVAVSDIRMVLELTLPTRRSVSGSPVLFTDKAIELVMMDGAHSPALFGSAGEVSKWIRADREDRCPQCWGRGTHASPTCSNTLTPSARGWD